MFRRPNQEKDESSQPAQPQPERISSVLGKDTRYQGKLTGSGGVRIEGMFEGEIALDGLLVVGTTGVVTCEEVRARTVIVAGKVKGDITANKVEIRASGRVWGNVSTTAFSTEEGAFLRGQIQMDEEMILDLPEDVVDVGGEDEGED